MSETSELREVIKEHLAETDSQLVVDIEFSTSSQSTFEELELLFADELKSYKSIVDGSQEKFRLGQSSDFHLITSETYIDENSISFWKSENLKKLETLRLEGKVISSLITFTIYFGFYFHQLRIKPEFLDEINHKPLKSLNLIFG